MNILQLPIAHVPARSSPILLHGRNIIFSNLFSNPKQQGYQSQSTQQHNRPRGIYLNDRLVFTGDHRSTVSYDTSPKASRRSLRRLGCVPALIPSCCARTVPPPLAAVPSLPLHLLLSPPHLPSAATLPPLPPPTGPFRITQAFWNKKRSKDQPMHSSRMLSPTLCAKIERLEE